MRNASSLPRRDRTRGAVAVALFAALLFGATTPVASVLARTVSPLWLSAALYAGVACVLAFAWSERRSLARGDVPWLALSALVGGVAAPVLLVVGLRATDAATASLLLATEPVATAAIAWLVVREHASRRTVAGMACIALGAIVLAWHGSPTASIGALAVVGAAICWGIDNNLARRIASSNAIAISGVKGIVAASVAIVLALALHDPRPPAASFGLGALLGLVGYGCSLVLYVRALRVLGTARTGAYFATAPFAGAILALAFGYAPLGGRLALAGALMALGVWLHATEHHEHEHVHPAEEHWHWHAHDDEHHLHAHPELDGAAAYATPHAHVHAHERTAHVHAHTPDEEHRHTHDPV
jgi:drug/metabolite transporter (DMT)-like permease